MLSQEARARIDREVAKYPTDQKQSAVMAALRIAQEEQGWLSNAAIESVASHLDMPAIAAFEVASFYNMYDLRPIGKYKLTVCTNLPCALSGGVHAAEYLKRKLGIDLNETTPDGKFTLKEGECMGACGDAPVMLVNNVQMRCFMTPDEIDKLLAECK
ncbi:MAG: NADH-quinone oxidoreductase subunit NuoE [Rhodocyclaceae bacterium]|nr:NADH-quinone oxidoreductase subunit NuoE [Rhodocyclaceae bacterium]MBK6552647.1 NADH-quinone oxidoreductase subunit NuoE [Rhodocyclaceae bacterium]MBK6676162.1 NADH-quinone oxidoreductase subunit NuoE [Rhodocyclaceae bacterium]MBK7815189.1 NADH-quinone oxidoreductase subunit NuoE [Rhodocyclaceae bacterium]MBK9312186.1 NADH-quinone oxidoreductase subunit NuoE [Rhodocyclaceae bacterium]